MTTRPARPTPCSTQRSPPIRSPPPSMPTGSQSILWAVTDPEFSASDHARILADKQIFIADGHHRYTTALAYRDLRREQALAAGAAHRRPRLRLGHDGARQHGRPRAARHADAPRRRRAGRLRRVGVSCSPRRALHRRATLAPANVAGALEGSAAPVFVVKVRGERAAVAGPGARRRRPRRPPSRQPKSSAWKHLDVAVLQELILDPLLDIHPDRAETLDRLTFIKDAGAALAANARSRRRVHPAPHGDGPAA